MSERRVLNASPLIALARAGHEDLLLRLHEEAIVPQAVVAEIEAGPLSVLFHHPPDRRGAQSPTPLAQEAGIFLIFGRVSR